MASRSMIGYEKEDGLIVFVYCHELGYPNYQLSLLISEYMDRNKVIDLVAKGSMRELKENINEISFFNQGYVSVCYSACKKGDYIQAMDESGCNYCYYLGLDGKWHYGLSSLGQDITKPESLPKEIKNKFEKI